MKTNLMLASLLLASVVQAGPTAPDFLGLAPPRHIDPSLVASQSTTVIAPSDIVAFRLDSDTLTEGGVSQATTAARWLATHPGYRIVLEGHTDASGLAAYNEDLANRRITAVRDRLLRCGIHSDRIVMVTYGEFGAIEPPNPNDRRVVMYATTLPLRQIANASLARHPGVVAAWTDRDAMIQVRNEPVTTARR